VQKLRYPCGTCQQTTKEAQREVEARANAELQQYLAPYIERTLSRTIDYSTLSDDLVLILIALERTINPRLLTALLCAAIAGNAPYYAGDFITKLYKAQVILDDPSKAKSGTYF